LASFRAWRIQFRRRESLEDLLVPEYVTRIHDERRRLSAGALSWASDQQEEDHYVKAINGDPRVAHRAFREWKSRQKTQPAPAIAIAESEWIEKPRRSRFW
jgi:hypothetical protein